MESDQHANEEGDSIDMCSHEAGTDSLRRAVSSADGYLVQLNSARPDARRSIFGFEVQN